MTLDLNFQGQSLKKPYPSNGRANTQVSQMQVSTVACCKPAGSYNRLPNVLYIFEHKMQYPLIHTPYTRILLFWHISDML